METKWRTKARVVAYLDLVLTSLTLLFFLLMTMTVGFLKEVAEDREKVNRVLKPNPKFKFQSDEEEIEIDQDFVGHSSLTPVNDVRVIRIALAIFAACTLFTSVHLWAAIKLVNATEVVETRDALKKTRFWKIVTTIYLSIHCAIAILALDFEFLVCNLAFMLLTRGVFMYVISKFREELEGALTSLVPAEEEPPPYVSVVKE